MDKAKLSASGQAQNTPGVSGQETQVEALDYAYFLGLGFRV